MHLALLPMRAHGRAPRVVLTSYKELHMLVAIIVGILAGFLAGQIMKGGGYGILIDLLLGLVGGLIGGWLFGMLGIGGGGIIWQIVIATVGAVILVAITRMIKRKA
jgi:uncharacterized membrane protein YeaQ/YmgE (transglycosylase-associated protein family)